MENIVRTTLFLISTVLFVSGCHEDSHGHRNNDSYPIADVLLDQFDIIDTYGINSEFDGTPLALSPYINFGEFEVFWNAYSDYDYFIELRFNTEPTTSGSRLISSELCGPFFYCYDHQYQYCDYTSGLDIVCETSSGDLQSAYIGDMLPNFPQDGFLILQVCDTSFYQCEYQSHFVSME